MLSACGKTSGPDIFRTSGYQSSHLYPLPGCSGSPVAMMLEGGLARIQDYRQGSPPDTLGLDLPYHVSTIS